MNEFTCSEHSVRIRTEIKNSSLENSLKTRLFNGLADKLDHNSFNIVSQYIVRMLLTYIRFLRPSSFLLCPNYSYVSDSTFRL